MRPTLFLTPEQVIELARQRFGSAVRDRGTIEGAVLRCQHTGGGQEVFPTLWDKAYALLHGLASTQGFDDGNKRAAWVAMETFLAINGVFLRRVVAVEAEVFVFAVFMDAISQDLAVAWLKAHRLRG